MSQREPSSRTSDAKQCNNSTCHLAVRTLATPFTTIMTCRHVPKDVKEQIVVMLGHSNGPRASSYGTGLSPRVSTPSRWQVKPRKIHGGFFHCSTYNLNPITRPYHPLLCLLPLFISIFRWNNQKEEGIRIVQRVFNRGKSNAQ
jgi:hypothetical protein